jgi:hypothetical protein
MSDPMPIKTINDIIKEIAETELENQQPSNTQTEEGECESCKPAAHHHPGRVQDRNPNSAWGNRCNRSSDRKLGYKPGIRKHLVL